MIRPCTPLGGREAGVQSVADRGRQGRGRVRDRGGQQCSAGVVQCSVFPSAKPTAKLTGSMTREGVGGGGVQRRGG